MSLYDWALQDSEFSDPIDFLGGTVPAGYIALWGDCQDFGTALSVDPATAMVIQGDAGRQRIRITPTFNTTGGGGVYFTSIAGDFVYLARLGLGIRDGFNNNTAEVQLVAFDGNDVTLNTASGGGLDCDNTQWDNNVLHSGRTNVGAGFTFNRTESQNRSKMSTVDIAIERDGTDLNVYASQKRGPFFKLGTPSFGGIVVGATPIAIRVANTTVGRSHFCYLRAFARVSSVPR